MFEINQIKNKINDLSKRIEVLSSMFDYQMLKDNLIEIKTELKKPDIWRDHKRAQKLSKESAFIELKIKTIVELVKSLDEISDLLDLAIELFDEATIHICITQLIQLEEKIIKLEFNTLFGGQYDLSNCYLDLQAGSGGTEAQDWTNMLMRMYLRWAESKNFKTEIIELSDGDIAGVKSATIRIIGKYAYGWLRTETGVHRLVRKSPFDSGGRRHTSFSSVFIYPELDDDIDIELHPSDLRIDVYRSSGAGGQHVNKTESAVRITHLPTGIVTQCQNDRSQHKNKYQALKQLKAKLYDMEIQKKNADKQELEKNKSDIGWGEQIRSYILDNSLIKDLRTGIDHRNAQAVLDGDLDKFIKASLKAGL